MYKCNICLKILFPTRRPPTTSTFAIDCLDIETKNLSYHELFASLSSQCTSFKTLPAIFYDALEAYCQQQSDVYAVFTFLHVDLVFCSLSSVGVI